MYCNNTTCFCIFCMELLCACSHEGLHQARMCERLKVNVRSFRSYETHTFLTLITYCDAIVLKPPNNSLHFIQCKNLIFFFVLFLVVLKIMKHIPLPSEMSSCVYCRRTITRETLAKTCVGLVETLGLWTFINQHTSNHIDVNDK